MNDVVPAEEIDDAVDRLAAKICEASSRTVAIGKEAFYAQIERDGRGAYDLTSCVMATSASTADALFAKRPPAWPEGYRPARRHARLGPGRRESATPG